MFISKICKHLLQINIKIPSTQEKKLAKDLNGYILKEGIEMAIKPMKRCSASLLEKCQSNCNKVSAHPLRMTILQQIYKDSMLQRRGEQGGLLHCGQGWKWVGAATRKTVWRFLKTLNIVATR